MTHYSQSVSKTYKEIYGSRIRGASFAEIGPNIDGRDVLHDMP